MKDLDIRIALEEVQGMSGPWRKIHVNYYNDKGISLPELTLDWLYEVAQNLDGKTNLMLENEGEQTQQDLFIEILEDIVLKTEAEEDVYYMTCNATKHQRAEAILRVLGKWRDG